MPPWAASSMNLRSPRERLAVGADPVDYVAAGLFDDVDGDVAALCAMPTCEKPNASAAIDAV
jgi:hypothetical protein